MLEGVQVVTDLFVGDCLGLTGPKIAVGLFPEGDYPQGKWSSGEQSRNAFSMLIS